jgi:anti-sigma regulatory factor (Ser/Thr protein kinase)
VPCSGRTTLPQRRLSAPKEPPATAELPGLKIVSRQYPAIDESGPRTRWLDAVSVSADRTALSTGAVTGTGPAASNLADRLRQESRAGALLCLTPAQVLARLRSQLGDDDGLVGTSLHLVHDGAAQTLALANAGHSPGVAVTPDGETTLIGAPVGPALSRQAKPYRTATLPFSPGASLVLVIHPPHCTAGRPTDGALTAEVAETRLFARGSGSLARLCEALARRLGQTCTEHPTTVMVAQSTGGIAYDHPSRRFPGDPASAAAARAFTLQTLDEWKLGEKANRAAVIIGELAANAIQHAGSAFEVRLSRAARAITLEVTDAGPLLSREDPANEFDSGAGGLLIVETLADRWGTRRSGDGKTVWAELWLAGGRAAATPRAR